MIVAEDEGGVAEAALRLARVGLENVTGYLAGGIAAWFRAGRTLATLAQWPVDELRAQLARTAGCRCSTCDGPASTRTATCPGALHVPLDRLAARSPGLDRRGRSP